MTEQLFSKMALIGFIGFGLSASAQNTPPLTPQNPAQQQTSQPSPQQAGSDQAGSDESVSQPKSAQPSPAQGNGAPRIAPGSVIPVQLTRSIDAKKVKVGEAVEGRVMQDLKAANGQGVVPKETRVVGHVTEVQARSKEQKESQIGIAFDHMVMKNGEEVALPMSIQAIIASSTSNPNNGGGGADAGPGAMPGAGGMSPGAAGGRPGMAGGAPPQVPTPTSGGQSQPGNNTQPRITGDTRGVVGISNLELNPGADAAQGSVVSSEKNNVKLESGTLMLLRVNP
jgi:hypothetical protein